MLIKLLLLSYFLMSRGQRVAWPRLNSAQLEITQGRATGRRDSPGPWMLPPTTGQQVSGCHSGRDGTSQSPCSGEEGLGPNF